MCSRRRRRRWSSSRPPSARSCSREAPIRRGWSSCFLAYRLPRLRQCSRPLSRTCPPPRSGGAHTTTPSRHGSCRRYRRARQLGRRQRLPGPYCPPGVRSSCQLLRCRFLSRFVGHRRPSTARRFRLLPAPMDSCRSCMFLPARPRRGAARAARQVRSPALRPCDVVQGGYRGHSEQPHGTGEDRCRDRGCSSSAHSCPSLISWLSRD